MDGTTGAALDPPPPPHAASASTPSVSKPPRHLPGTKFVTSGTRPRPAALRMPATPIAPMTRSIRLVLTCLSLFPSILVAQKPLVLSKAEAEYAEPFTQITGLRELKDGRVLIADARDKTLQLIDLQSGSATKVGREGQGPGEYSLPLRVIALPGDSAAVYDAGNQRYLIVHPDGKTGKDFRLEAAVPPAAGARGGEGGRAGGMMVMLSAPRGADAKGNIYYEGSAFSMSPEGTPTQSDTAPVIKFDRQTPARCSWPASRTRRCRRYGRRGRT